MKTFILEILLIAVNLKDYTTADQDHGLKNVPMLTSGLGNINNNNN